MSDFDRLRGYESELHRRLARLAELIDQYAAPRDAYGLEYEFNRMLGQWRAVLTWRDRLVYHPAIIAPDRARAAAAEECRARMNLVAAEVEEFARCWSSSALIATAFASFKGAALLLVAEMSAALDEDCRVIPVFQRHAA